MNKEFIQLCIIAFCINATVYSVHNFISSILESTDNFSMKEIVWAQGLYIFKFMSAVLLTNLCDRKGVYRQVLMSSLVLFALAAFFLSVIKSKDKKSVKNSADGLNFQKYACYGLLSIYTMANGGLFPIIESMCMQYLRKYSSPTKINRFRLVGTFGHLLVNLILTGFHKVLEGYNGYESWKYRINSLTGLFFSFLGVLICFLGKNSTVKRSENDLKSEYSEKIYNLENKKQNRVESHNIATEQMTENVQSNNSGNENGPASDQSASQPKNEQSKLQFLLSTLKLLSSVTFYLFSISVLLSGIDRACISQNLPQYLKLIGLDLKDVHFMFFIRTVPELLLYGISEFLAKFLSIDMIYSLALILTLSRSLFYGIVNFEDVKLENIKKIVISTECSKGLYSALFHYSSLRIFNTFANEKSVSTVQGIFYSLYNSVPYLFLPIFSAAFSDEDSVAEKLKSYKTIFKIVGFLVILSFIGPIYRTFTNLKKKRTTL